MMCDAAVETMVLIRAFDDESKFDTRRLYGLIQHFLDHVTWMFFDGGVFQIQGHVAFIMQWFETSTHHFVCGKRGMSMGGSPFPEVVKEKALKQSTSFGVEPMTSC